MFNRNANSSPPSKGGAGGGCFQYPIKSPPLFLGEDLGGVPFKSRKSKTPANSVSLPDFSPKQNSQNAIL